MENKHFGLTHVFTRKRKRNLSRLESREKRLKMEKRMMVEPFTRRRRIGRRKVVVIMVKMMIMAVLL